MPIERCTFEDDFPIMFKFYHERGKLSEFQLQKVHEIQQRWKTGLVFWLTHDNQEIEIPEWVAVNVIINNKQNIGRGSRICMSLNHTKGYGCNRLNEGTCTYVHECALCGQDDHGVFQKKGNGSWICQRLRKWYEEEERYKALGFGDPRKHEEELTALARRARPAKTAGLKTSVVSVWAVPKPGPISETPDAKAAPCQQADTIIKAPLAGDEIIKKPAAVDEIIKTPAVGPCDDNINDTRQGRSPPSQPPPPRLPQNWQAVWNDEHQQYYYWNTETNATTWEAPELDAGTLKAAREAVLRARTSQVSGGPLEKAPTKEEKNADKEPSAEKDAEKGVGESRVIDAGTYVCSQHWRPQPGVESCLRVFHGERVVVTWVDGLEGGWAYGHVDGDEPQAGYFPKAVLAASPRAPQLPAPGEICCVAERFVAPEEVGGYLSVAPGDALRLLTRPEPPGAWVYAERDAPAVPGAPAGAVQEVGWVPTVVLKDFAGTAGEGPKPHPAG